MVNAAKSMNGHIRFRWISDSTPSTSDYHWSTCLPDGDTRGVERWRGPFLPRARVISRGLRLTANLAWLKKARDAATPSLALPNAPAPPTKQWSTRQVEHNAIVRSHRGGTSVTRMRKRRTVYLQSRRGGSANSTTVRPEQQRIARRAPDPPACRYRISQPWAARSQYSSTCEGRFAPTASHNRRRFSC